LELTERSRILGLFAACTLAFTMPLLELLARGADFFVVRRSSEFEIVLLVLCWSLLPTVLLLLLGNLLERVRPGTGLVAHGISLALTLTCFVLCSLPADEGWIPTSVLSLALVIGFLVTAQLMYSERMHGLLEAMAPLGPLLILHFLFFSPVSSLVLPGAVDPGNRLAARAAKADLPHVILLVLDELPLIALLNRAGEIDSVRFPGFSRLASMSTWYRNALTVHPHTGPAVAAIATGRRDILGRAASWRCHKQTLFTALKGSHHLKVVEHSVNLCPPSLSSSAKEGEPFRIRFFQAFQDATIAYLHIVTPGRWKRELPSIANQWKHFWKERGGPNAPWKLLERKEEFESFLASIKDTKIPTFFYHHALLPHHPWVYYPDGTTSEPGDLRGLLGRSPEKWEMLEQYRAFTLQLRFVDAMLLELLDKLSSENLLDRSLLIVTADHGMSFLPRRDVRTLSGTNLGEILPVPLFVHYPGGLKQGDIDLQKARIIDIAPTIFASLEMVPPWRMDGVDLRTSRPEPIGLEPLSEVEVDYGQVLRYSYSDLQRLIADLRGGGKFPDRLEVGPFGFLAGSHVADWPRERSTEKVLGVDQFDPALFAGSSGSLPPSRLSGWVLDRPGLPGHLNLAIALNDRIQTTTGTFEHGKGQRFSTLLPSDRRPGKIRFFEIETRGPSSLTLVELPLRRNVSYLLEDGIQGARIRRLGGEVIPISLPYPISLELQESGDGLVLMGQGPASTEVFAFACGEWAGVRVTAADGGVQVHFPSPNPQYCKTEGFRAFYVEGSSAREIHLQ
jgi:hypothetical protein